MTRFVLELMTAVVKFALLNSAVAEEEVSEKEEACSRCGSEALGDFGEEILCEACYHASASCCGFSEDG